MWANAFRGPLEGVSPRNGTAQKVLIFRAHHFQWPFEMDEGGGGERYEVYLQRGGISKQPFVQCIFEINRDI